MISTNIVITNVREKLRKSSCKMFAKGQENSQFLIIIHSYYYYFRLEYARCNLLLCDISNYNWLRGSDPAQRAPNNPSDARQKRIGLPLRTHQPCAFQ